MMDRKRNGDIMFLPIDRLRFLFFEVVGSRKIVNGGCLVRVQL